MSFDTQVAEISSADLDKLFDATPNTTPTADELALGKQEANSASAPVVATDDSALPEFDDSLMAEEAEGDDKEKKETGEDSDDDDTLDENDKSKNASKVSNVLKNTVEYLVEQGLWSDFEGREDMEITQETYAELSVKQAQHAAYEIVNELIDSTGEYGKAIISHIKAGGNPDEIIDLFKEQKELAQIDTSTEKGKQSKIEKYYKEVLGWKNEKVNKHLGRIIADDDVDSEFQEIEELYDKHYQEELSKKQEVLKEQELKNTEKQQAFVSNIKNALAEDLTIPEKDKKLIASSILDFKHKLDNGQKVNDFYLKFAEMQADPKQYIKLVRYVMDNEGYEKQLQQQEKTKANKEVFSFIKGNAAVSKAKSTNIEIDNSSSTRTQGKRGTDFSFAIKK